MSRSWITTLMAAAIITGFGFIGQAISQEAPAPTTSESDRAGRQRDPEQTRQRMEQFRQQAAERIKTELGVTDDEWKILAPKIEKVGTLAMQTRGGMMMGRRGGRSSQADANPSEVQQKAKELRTVLENKDAKPDEIKAALTSYRDARTKAKEELQKAQKELQELVTVRQEAQLVSFGLLE